jgi:hypothetical protein
MNRNPTQSEIKLLQMGICFTQVDPTCARASGVERGEARSKP